MINIEATRTMTGLELEKYLAANLKPNDEVHCFGRLHSVIAGPIIVRGRTYFWVLDKDGMTSPNTATPHDMDVKYKKEKTIEKTKT
jgi:hypothetical protein